MTRYPMQRLDDPKPRWKPSGNTSPEVTLPDGLVFDAVRVRLIEIGEAVKDLPPELLEHEPEIPWNEIVGMRDRLAHRYFDTSHVILQGTVTSDLPELRVAITHLRELLTE